MSRVQVDVAKQERINTILLGVTIALLVVGIIIVIAFYATNKQKTSSSLPKALPMKTLSSVADTIKTDDAFADIPNAFLPVAEKDAGNDKFAISTATDFAELIDGPASILEISPFEKQITGSLKLPKPSTIDWVKSGSVIQPDKKYDAVISSKAIEFEPNFVKHLQTIHDSLKPGGKYFAVVPDHRYNMTHFMTPSSLAQILKAHLENKTTLPSEALFEHTALVTHNDAVRHWRGDHGDPSKNRSKRIKDAEKELKAKGTSASADVHAWYFTPHTFAQIVRDLNDASHCPLEMHELFLTPANKSDFFAILSRPVKQ